jgi:hypothetical protein
MAKKAVADCYLERNEGIRIDVVQKLEARTAPPLRAFFRRLGAAHVYEELIVPTLEKDKGLLVAAVRDRPWPPWGIDALRVHALVHVHPIGDAGASLSGILVSDDDGLNLGLAAAVYKETLEWLARRKVKDVSYLVREGSYYADKVLAATGIDKTEDLFLTEQARYNVYRGATADHLKRLELDGVSTPDLLSHKLGDRVLDRFAGLWAVVDRGSRPYWRDWGGGVPGIIPNTGGGLDASQPGGVDTSPPS